MQAAATVQHSTAAPHSPPSCTRLQSRCCFATDLFKSSTQLMMRGSGGGGCNLISSTNWINRRSNSSSSSTSWRSQPCRRKMRATSPINRALTCTTTSNHDLLTTTITTTTTTTTKPPTRLLNPPITPRPHEAADELDVQELTVYEVNQLDRGSPVLLSLSKLAVDWYNRFHVQPLRSLGDLVPFSNKIFDGSLKKRLGITAGMISVIRHYPENDSLLFEAVYSFYFGDFGHISVKGPYSSHEDTTLTVTGGSGIFTGVYGTVQIQNVEYPFVLFYRFQLRGIQPLPKALQWKTLPPAKGLRPSLTASFPGVALPNFTD